MQKYSIIIPTHNRHNLMIKNIAYFSLFKDCHIYVCDSTENEYPNHYDFPSHMTYIHLPNKSFIEKLSHCTNLVNTKYVAICGDDDFLVEKTLLELVEKLQKDEEFSIATGRWLSFDIPYKSGDITYMYKQLKHRSLLQNTARERVEEIMTNAYQLTYLLYRKDILKKGLDILSKVDYQNDFLMERALIINCAIEGKIFFSKNILGVRECQNEYNLSWAKKEQLPYDFFLEDKDKFDEIVADFDKFNEEKLFSYGIYASIKAYFFKDYSKIEQDCRKSYNQRFPKKDDKDKELNKVLVKIDSIIKNTNYDVKYS